MGEIGEHEKAEFLGNAMVTLFPIDWPEPFGMVMIESLACGTPVIAYNHGSVPEVIDDDKSGFIVRNLDEALSALKKIDTISRETCRTVFEERFTTKRMAAEYRTLFSSLVDIKIDSKGGREVILYGDTKIGSIKSA
jgi:glycosyltransferase involved in cell wall biosynthesis